MGNERAVHGYKRVLMNWFERFTLGIPFLSESANQVLSKDMAILAAWHFISRCEVEGDYFEFGVFRGETFRNAMTAAHKIFSRTRVKRFNGTFFAFDSFQGLPRVDSMGTSENIYEAGEFSASRAIFEKTLGKWKDRYPVRVVEGWFNEVLTPRLSEELAIRRAAFVNIDCDLYESTLPVLDFITPHLQTGTVLYFDDWFSIKGSMSYGEPKATEEWLQRHPEIRLVEYRPVGITGKMFIVNRLERESLRHASAR